LLYRGGLDPINYMARREQTITKDPDVEVSQAELQALEGVKSTIQTETLAVAKNKQELEQAFEEAKERLDRELETKSAAHFLQLDAMEQKYRNIEMTISTNESVQKMIQEETAVLEQVRELVKKDIAELHDNKGTVSAEVVRLLETQHLLEDNIRDLRVVENALDEKNKLVHMETIALSAKLKQEFARYDQLIGNHTVLREKVTHLSAIHADVQSKIDAINKDLVGKVVALRTATNDLMDVQKRVADHKQSMAVLESEISARAGNAARLEQHVDKKLDHLKQIEQNFTNERLAAHGYKRT